MGDWPLKTSPVDYLQRYPDGPHAAVARGIMAGQIETDPKKLDPAVAGFVVGTWGGIPNYSCKLCPYATTDKALMQRHLALGQHIGGRYSHRLA